MFCHRAKWHTCSADTFIWAAPYTLQIYSSNHLLSKDKVVLLVVVVFCSMTDWASKCLFQTKFLPELDWVNRTQPGLLWSETTWYATAFNQNGVSWLPRVGQMFLLNSYLYLFFFVPENYRYPRGGYNMPGNIQVLRFKKKYMKKKIKLWKLK